jgi:hypothetical protein
LRILVLLYIPQTPTPTEIARQRPTRLVETDGLTHGSFDVKGFDVLPVLLEERDQEVDG